MQTRGAMAASATAATNVPAAAAPPAAPPTNEDVLIHLLETVMGFGLASDVRLAVEHDKI